MDRRTQRVTRSRKGFGHVYLRGSTWWIKWHIAGEQQFESSKSDNKSDAEELLKKRLNEAYGRARTKIVFMDELLDDLLSYYEVHRERSYKDFAKPFVDGKNGLREYFGRMKPAHVTTERVNAFQRKLKASGQENGTINRKMALLRRAFRLAMATTPPKADRIPFFHKLPENPARRGFLEWDAYYKLVEAIDPDVRPLLMVAYHTGAREGELLAVTLSQVDLDARRIVLRSGTTKNDEGRYLPIYGDMIPALTAQVAELRAKYPKCKHLFHRAGSPVLDIRAAWAKATAAVGMPELLFHDLRRSAARNMRKAGIHDHTIMKIGGWRTDSMFRRYDIIDDSDMDAAADKMAAQSKKAKAKKKTTKALR